MRALFLAALIAFAIDQGSKYWVIFAMDLVSVRSIDVLPPLVNFRYGENYGINFGIGGGVFGRWFLIGIALAICVGLIWWIRREAMPLVCKIAGGLIIGGALGNVFDRVAYGYVLDFLNMSCCGIDNPFSFNLADVFIFAGAFGLIFLAPNTKKPA